MGISYNWFGFKFHWTHPSGVYDTHWLATASEKSKAGINVVPTNLPTTIIDSNKSYDILNNIRVIVISSALSPIISKIVYV